MPSRSPAHDSVGAGHHVDVIVYVHLQRPQNHKVQLIDKGSLVHGIGVLGSRNLKMPRIVLNGLNRPQIKGLRIHNIAHQPRVQKIAHGLGDTADGKAHMDIFLLHNRPQHGVDRQRSPARAGLEGEAVLKKWGQLNEPGTILRHL